MTDSTLYKLVIFDMDGTLVDSETIADYAVSESTKNLSRSISQAEARERFRGRDLEFMMKEFAEINGAPVSEEFLLSLNANYIEALSTQLQPTKGAVTVVASVREKAAVCVASNGEPDAIAFSLKSAGLTDLFDGHIYSYRDAGKPKPAPDLFLYAAAQLGVDPSECLVVEDSPVGLRAARDAGMDAIGFCGNEPGDRETLEATGFPVIDNFEDVIGFFEAGRGA